MILFTRVHQFYTVATLFLPSFPTTSIRIACIYITFVECLIILFDLNQELLQTILWLTTLGTALNIRSHFHVLLVITASLAISFLHHVQTRRTILRSEVNAGKTVCHVKKIITITSLGWPRVFIVEDKLHSRFSVKTRVNAAGLIVYLWWVLLERRLYILIFILFLQLHREYNYVDTVRFKRPFIRAKTISRFVM